MNTTERTTLISAWIKASSDDEKTQQDRAERMVKEAIDSHPAFQGDKAKYRIYPKGSYHNNTNVRRDSDVDIVVELQECIYYGWAPGVTPSNPKPSSYSGGWTPKSWRAEVAQAIKNKFGSTDVDDTGNIAINVVAKDGSRPSIDIVPSFKYHRYGDTARSSRLTDEGSCVWSKADVKIVNWPHHQYDNGVVKNTATGSRYKNFVRVLKNAENTLARAGTIKEMPSYFMECLIYNVDNTTLQTGDLNAGFKATLVALHSRLKNEATSRMLEPNAIKYLFHAKQKWTVEMGLELVNATWDYLSYGDDNG